MEDVNEPRPPKLSEAIVGRAKRVCAAVDGEEAWGDDRIRHEHILQSLLAYLDQQREEMAVYSKSVNKSFKAVKKALVKKAEAPLPGSRRKVLKIEGGEP